MFWTAQRQRVQLEDIYRGYSCFLVSNGPSLKTMDLAQLSRPGVLTLGLNNGPAAFRPNIWVMGDDVKSFVRSIWLDPKILKFVPFEKASHKLWNSDTWSEMTLSVGDCPSIVYFDRAEEWSPETYLTEDRIHWGLQAWKCSCGYDHEDIAGKKEKPKGPCPKCGNEGNFGCRSVLFLAIKLAYALGVRTLYLLGCDFRMSSEYAYAFEQKREKGAVKNNNAYYRQMDLRFAQFAKHFPKYGFKIFNCTPESGLTAFPKKDFGEALAEATAWMPPAERDAFGNWICKERTQGLYDRKADEKHEKERSKKFKSLEEFVAWQKNRRALGAA